MKKKFELESVEINVPGHGNKTHMVFSAFDESGQCFVKMVCKPRTIKTIRKPLVQEINITTLKVIEGEIIEIVKYV